jgi:hypothetical protein
MKERMSTEGFLGRPLVGWRDCEVDPSRGSSMHRSGKSQLPIELADGAALEVKSKTEANFRVALKNK